MQALILRALVLSCIFSAAATGQAKSGVRAKVDQAVRAGVALLLETQEHYVGDSRVRRMLDDQVEAWQKTERDRLRKLRDEPGQVRAEWPYEGVYRVRGIVPAGYRVGGTAIVCEALVLAPGYADEELRRAAVERGIDFMLAELKASEQLTPGPKRGYDVRGWAHTYALEFFLLALRRGVVAKERRTAVKAMIPHLLECLKSNEAVGGGWNYANSGCSPFMTGSTLLALYQARAQGFEFDHSMVTRALGALERARLTTGSYVYSGESRAARPAQPARNIGRRRRSSSRTAMAGACARATIAELCLLKAGRSDMRRLRGAVDAFFEHWSELLRRKSQQGTHQGPYGIAPYYFMYGHTYAALAIEALPESDRPALRQKMQATLWRTRETDGGWNDRIFPRSKSYSTAMAVWALVAPQLAPSPDWSATAAEKPPGAKKKKKKS